MVRAESLPGHAQGSPPRVSGRLPGAGHIAEFMRVPLDVIERGYREHGPVFTFSLAGRQAVTMLGPEYHRFFFAGTDGRLSIRVLRSRRSRDRLRIRMQELIDERRREPAGPPDFLQTICDARYADGGRDDHRARELGPDRPSRYQAR